MSTMQRIRLDVPAFVHKHVTDAARVVSGMSHDDEERGALWPSPEAADELLAALEAGPGEVEADAQAILETLEWGLWDAGDAVLRGCQMRTESRDYDEIRAALGRVEWFVGQLEREAVTA